MVLHCDADAADLRVAIEAKSHPTCRVGAYSGRLGGDLQRRAAGTPRRLETVPEADQLKELSQRWHDCPSCGLSLGRDHNAGRNMVALGMSAAGLALQNV